MRLWVFQSICFNRIGAFQSALSPGHIFFGSRATLSPSSGPRPCPISCAGAKRRRMAQCSTKELAARWVGTFLTMTFHALAIYHHRIAHSGTHRLHCRQGENRPLSQCQRGGASGSPPARGAGPPPGNSFGPGSARRWWARCPVSLPTLGPGRPPLLPWTVSGPSSGRRRA